MRHQLQGTSVRLIELIPPYVQTELSGPDQSTDPYVMPLADFIAEVTSSLKSEPEVPEVRVEREMTDRCREVSGVYAARCAALNSRPVSHS